MADVQLSSIAAATAASGLPAAAVAGGVAAAAPENGQVKAAATEASQRSGGNVHGEAPGDGTVKSAVADANLALAAIGTQLVFVFDDQAHHLAVKLLDVQTQKVLQQIPSKAMPATASALSGPSSSGALVDTKA